MELVQALDVGTTQEEIKTAIYNSQVTKLQAQMGLKINFLNHTCLVFPHYSFSVEILNN